MHGGREVRAVLLQLLLSVGHPRVGKRQGLGLGRRRGALSKWRRASRGWEDIELKSRNEKDWLGLAAAHTLAT